MSGGSIPSKIFEILDFETDIVEDDKATDGSDVTLLKLSAMRRSDGKLVSANDFGYVQLPPSLASNIRSAYGQSLRSSFYLGLLMSEVRLKLDESNATLLRNTVTKRLTVKPGPKAASYTRGTRNAFEPAFQGEGRQLGCDPNDLAASSTGADGPDLTIGLLSPDDILPDPTTDSS